MDIGQKIKKIRTAKLMTQSELAGSHITRNMLSRIENGSAQPSLQTVTYIAQRLNVSPGFLLAQEEDEPLYFRAAEIGNIKKAYVDQDHKLCREMCKNSEWEDDELLMILAQSTLRVGVEEFEKGALRSALSLLDEALENARRTIYDTRILVDEAKAYFEYMRTISPTLASDADEDIEADLLISDDFCIYSDIFCQAEQNGFDSIPLLRRRIERLGDNNSYALHLTARSLMEKGEYAQAKEILYGLLTGESHKLPEPVMYFVLCDLEVCCKETADYKGAYEYSQSRIGLLQKMLS